MWECVGWAECVCLCVCACVCVCVFVCSCLLNIVVQCKWREHFIRFVLEREIKNTWTLSKVIFLLRTQKKKEITGRRWTGGDGRKCARRILSCVYYPMFDAVLHVYFMGSVSCVWEHKVRRIECISYCQHPPLKWPTDQSPAEAQRYIYCPSGETTVWEKNFSGT
jgi:hypothetical protein